ncbi:hypothetical protein J7E96_18990 [Streptomyces sp. ISL-96]|uniref:hypothetical protein n=1 Tax=Streptomyces sp. ISL-96 TaxID=2819191 RepID=UPI001BE8E35A|nr:hypothetical protein [Streptomyces sp. ISL-96]MBT2490561.1 hypothetical protein [Streptomyces sp. ISL-96]
MSRLRATVARRWRCGQPGFLGGSIADLSALVPVIAAVDIRLRRSPFHNEMSRHRYDAVLRKAGGPTTVTDVSDCPSLVWGADVHDLSELAGRATATRSPVRIVEIPNARITGEVRALRALGEGDAAGAAVALTEPDPAAVDPETLARRVESVLDVALTLAHDRPGHFEAVLVPRRPVRPALTGTYRHPAQAPARPGPLAEIPAAAHQAGRFADRLHGWLHERLGDRAKSVEIVVLDALPLGPDGVPAPRAADRTTAP